MTVMKYEKELYNEAKVGEWLDCLFEDVDSGEQFLVERKKEEGETAVDFVNACSQEALEYFERVEFLRLMDNKEAEVLGYDTY